MALVGAILLVLILLLRPQEIFPALEKAQPIYVATGLTVAGVVYDIATRKTRDLYSPQLPWLLLFLVWAFVATILKLGVTAGFVQTQKSVLFSGIFMVAVMYGVRSFERYRTLGVAIIVIGTMISGVMIDLARRDPQCLVNKEPANPESEWELTGRSCDTAYICEKEGTEFSHADWRCEKAGYFGTTTQGLRVSWLGTLNDPNELSVLIGASLPFLLAFAQIAKKAWFTVLMAILAAAMLYCVVLTGSRGGQLVVITVFGVYFVRRYGVRGLIIGMILGLPVLLFGGREGEEAESSSKERAELLYEGIDMMRANLASGVGVGEFNEYTSTHLTAHNSYLLAAAEMGIPGSILWSMLMYVSVKIPYVLAKRPPADVDPRLPPLAYALFVSFCGILVGIFFLSFCYKQMLFIYLGLAGALYGVVRRANPSFSIKISKKEFFWVMALDAALIAFIFVYGRMKGAA